MKENEYKSTLAPFFYEYIQLKKAAAQNVKSIQYVLRQFDDFLLSIDYKEDTITKSMIEVWSGSRPNDAPMTMGHKYSIWANLGKYIQSKGIKCYIAKNPTKVLTRPGFVPYIFTETQIQEIFNQSSKLRNSNGQKRISCLNTVPSLLRLLYSTGMRIGEAKSLKLGDVHLESKYLIVRCPKNRHDRIIPLCDSLISVLSEYLVIRMRIMNSSHHKNDFFFVKNDGSPLSHTCVTSWFHVILNQLGIPILGDGFGPRIHDLRHTFAVHSLKKMLSEGMEFFSALLILSKVLGHRNIKATEHYIRLTETEYPKISSLYSEYMSNVYPAIQQHEEK